MRSSASALTFTRKASPPNWLSSPRQDLLIALLQSLYREAQALSAEPTGAALNILRRFEGASSWIRGKHVHVDEAEGYSGVTAGLDARGFLQVRTPQGL